MPDLERRDAGPMPWQSLEDRIRDADRSHIAVPHGQNDDELYAVRRSQRSRLTRANWFGFKSPERNYMSWVKFFTYMSILASAMFLQLQLQDEKEQPQQIETLRAMLSHPTRRSQAPYTLPAVDPSVHMIKLSDKGLLHQDTALGAIYLALALLSFVVSTHDYYACIRQLEAEHTYLDECEGHTHPMVTILSCVIGLMVMATALLMLVQREV